VDHGISDHSGRWAVRCREICTEFAVPLRVQKVVAGPRTGESPEDAARTARYRAFEDILGENDVLVLGQHQDDQAETVLLQLLRGAGPAGLAAMARMGRFHHAWIWRPFIETSAAMIRNYNAAHGLSSIRDPSNDDTRLDRNFLRHEVMPILRSRWPKAAATLSRSARHCAEAKSLNEEVAAGDLIATCDQARSLSIEGLLRLSAARRRSLLRLWLRRLGRDTPSSAHMVRIENDLLMARSDRQPRVSWADSEIRRYRGRLYALPRSDFSANGFRAPLVDRQPTDLPDGSTVCLGGALSSALLGSCRLEVCYRRGGERLRPQGSSHRRSLKQLFQEAGVPPWERDRHPLLLADGAVAAVADLWVGHDFIADPGEEGLRFTWQIAGSSVSLGPR
jgi:tRNA(Ile)-lysidine synthase